MSVPHAAMVSASVPSRRALVAVLAASPIAAAGIAVATPNDATHTRWLAFRNLRPVLAAADERVEDAKVTLRTAHLTAAAEADAARLTAAEGAYDDVWDEARSAAWALVQHPEHTVDAAAAALLAGLWIDRLRDESASDAADPYLGTLRALLPQLSGQIAEDANALLVAAEARGRVELGHLDWWV